MACPNGRSLTLHERSENLDERRDGSEPRAVCEEKSLPSGALRRRLLGAKPRPYLPSAGDLGAGPLAVAAWTLFFRNPVPVSALAVAEAEV